MDRQEMPRDEILRTAFEMYQTSDMTNTLKSERNRTMFAESFESKNAPLLSTSCLKVIARNYKGSPIVNLNLKPMQYKTLYDFINPELPIRECINIVDEYFWKRVFIHMCKDKLVIKEKSKDKNTCWKNLAITLKLLELIENTPVEIWIADEMDKVSKLASPYVIEMKISKLQPLRDSSFEKQPPESDTELGEEAGEEEEFLSEHDVEEIDYDYPVEDCHHVDLVFVKNLQHLHTLIIEFLPPELTINYHSRYFNFSYYDMQNLASGISELPNLKAFIIRRSRMDSIKLSTILEALKAIFVEHLEFYYCQLDDECGECLYEFLISTATLKRLDLSGNYLREAGIDYLASGIRNSPSRLRYLGLTNNPISNPYACILTKTLLSCEELTHLTLSGIKVTKPGAKCVAHLIKFHSNLEELELLAVPMDGYTLVDALENNKKIQQLLCQGCGLTLEEEFNIELLLKRNRYIRKNPYIGDPTRTEDEILEFVTRVKNPVLLSAFAMMDKHTECRRTQAERDAERRAERESATDDEQDIVKDRGSMDSEATEGVKDFTYNATEFTEEQLDERVALFSQTETNFFKKQKPRKK